MPILIDYNQIAIGSLTGATSGRRAVELNERTGRNLILYRIGELRAKFRKEYGDIIICCDGESYWRKDYFEHYKGARKKQRDASPHDWTLIFDIMAQVRQELIDFFPYKVIRTPSAEADDVIAVLVKYFASYQEEGQLMPKAKPCLIVSADGDMQQLQIYPHVKQYCPTKKTFLNQTSPAQFLVEKIISGDTGDGVPNILSDDDTLVNPLKRQSRMTQKRLNSFMQHYPKVDAALSDSSHARNWKRNKTLIDLLTSIPKRVQSEIIAAYENAPCKSGAMTMYTVKNGVPTQTINALVGA